MEQQFWIDKWSSNEMGFQQPDVNELLPTFWHHLHLSQGASIFVPLCGKSLDMVWLVQEGFRVVGSELSERAAEQFFKERQLVPLIAKLKDEQDREWILYQTDDSRLVIIVGDYFLLSQQFVEKVAGQAVNGAYDRAAMVAMPDSMRSNYTHQLKRLVPSAKVFLVALEFEHQGGKPPFPIFEAELETMAKGLFAVKKLGEQESDVKGTSALEVAYVLNGKTAL